MAIGRNEEHAYKLFQRDLKANELSGLVILCGHEEYLSLWALNSMVKAYVNPAMRSMDFIELSAAECVLDDIVLACETLPFASAKKIVHLYGFTPFSGKKLKSFDSDAIDRLCEYAKELPENVLLVISGGEVPEREKPEEFKKLSAAGRVYDFKVLSDKKLLSGFIEKRFREAGKNVAPEIIKALTDASGYLNDNTDYDLFRMVNDIKKIAIFAGENAPSVRDVEELVSASLDSFIFHLTDALSSGRKNEAYRIFSNSMSNPELGEKGIFPMLSAIVSQYELMLDVKELSERGMGVPEMARALGKKSEYPVQKALRFSGKYSEKELRSVLSAMYETDRNIKSGLMPARLAMEALIAGI